MCKHEQSEVARAEDMLPAAQIDRKECGIEWNIRGMMSRPKKKLSVKYVLFSYPTQESRRGTRNQKKTQIKGKMENFTLIAFRLLVYTTWLCMIISTFPMQHFVKMEQRRAQNNLLAKFLITLSIYYYAWDSTSM